MKAVIRVKTAATRFEELVAGTKVEIAGGALALELPPETVRLLKVLPEGTEPKLP
ncbi:MAG TPA: hypothetical protein P5026_12210 [Kiritimatiellia bacterium]|nr:hypothetical protein [Kiritimatiellia bacterium]HRR34859.1 hypothetical protein [Kiritimatiellia bacterium]